MKKIMMKKPFLAFIGLLSFSVGCFFSFTLKGNVNTAAAYGNYTDVNPSTFYNAIDVTQTTTLLGQLHDLVVTKHRSYTSYNENGSGLLQAQTDVDPNNSNNIIDFYSGYSISKTWRPNDDGGYNREHVWCQSLSSGLWGETYGGGDIHHIRPEERAANSTRNNHPFGEISLHDSTTARYIKGTDGKYIYDGGQFGWYKNGVDVFEPMDNKKGDVARIVLYMYTHYTSYDYFTGAKTNGSLTKGSSCGYLDITDIMSPSSEKDCFAMLLKWNESDPVDALETNRNNVAAKLTGTRNPYIDHPEYANIIWGGVVPSKDPSISMDESASILVGNTHQLNAVINNGTGTISYQSNNNAVASVSSSGLITGVSKGSATITASATVGSKNISATCEVEVEENEITSISISQEPRYVSYFENDYFIADDLKITVNYKDSSSEVVGYNDYPDLFTFAPSLDTELTTSDTNVVIGYEGKEVNCPITVKKVDSSLSSSVNIKLSSPTTGTIGEEKENYISWSSNDSGVTVTQRKGNGTSAVNHTYSTSPRLYKGHYLSFVSTNGRNIGSISITYKDNYYGNNVVVGTSLNGTSVVSDIANFTTNFSSTKSGTHTITCKNKEGFEAIYLQNTATGSNIQLRPTSISIRYIGEGDTYYTDKLTVDLFPSSYSTYYAWKDVSVSGGSKAIYAGYTATNYYDVIKINDQADCGIASTYFGGVIKSVSVTWNDYYSSSGDKLYVYASNTAYRAPDSKGTPITTDDYIGVIECGASTTFNFKKTQDYNYVYVIGGGTIYLDSISFSYVDYAKEYTARNWAMDFKNNMTCNNGVSAPDKATWNEYATSYSKLSSNARNYFDTALYTLDGSIVTGDSKTYQTVAEAAARYDAVVGKYSSSDYPSFMNREVKGNYYVSSFEDQNVLVISIIAIFSLSSLSCLFYLAKKKKTIR